MFFTHCVIIIVQTDKQTNAGYKHNLLGGVDNLPYTLPCRMFDAERIENKTPETFSQHVIEADVMDNVGELRPSSTSPRRGTNGVEWCLASAATWCSSTFTVCTALIVLLSNAVLHHVSATDTVQSSAPHRVPGMF